MGCFAAAAALRSNGVLLMGFPLFDAVGNLLQPRRMLRFLKLLALSAFIAAPLYSHEYRAMHDFCLKSRDEDPFADLGMY